MRTLGFLLVAFSAGSSWAQPEVFCPYGPLPHRQNLKCGSSMRGDPIDMLSGYTLDVVKDFTIGVGDESFTFTRTFSSSVEAALLFLDTTNGYRVWPSDLKPPFGHFGLGGATPGANNAPRWLHSLFSAVRVFTYQPAFPAPPLQKVAVLVPEMYWTEFQTTCFASSPCFLQPKAHTAWNGVATYGYNGTQLRLQQLGSLAARRFILIREDGEHWRYEPDPASTEISRLVSVEDRLGRTRYTLTYSVPTGCSGYGFTTLKDATFRNGSKLEFDYSPLLGTQCVLSAVRFVSGNPASSATMVSYTYDSFDAFGRRTAINEITSATRYSNYVELYKWPTQAHTGPVLGWRYG